MTKSNFVALLMSLVLIMLTTGWTVSASAKPAELKVVPIAQPISKIDAAGAPGVLRSPADVCHGEWHGPMAFSINGWFTGNEYYAVYQDPVETGCPNTYPFGIVDIRWLVYSQDSITFDIQPLVYDYVAPGSLGPLRCAGPVYNIHLPESGIWSITMPLGDTCCVSGPYYAGVHVPTDLGPDILDIITDDGVVVPPRSDACFNDYGSGWRDLVDDEGFLWNLKLWSEGFNSDQNVCFQLAVPPGVDLWETPNDSASVDSHFYAATALPPDFFGPGSDPFDGIIYYEGSPLPTTPPGILGPTDVIVQRFEPAELDGLPSADTVPIQIVAMSLVSTSPITVTYMGIDPEDWNVQLCLSSIMQQSVGQMRIIRHCEPGGSFHAELPVTSKLVFTRIGDGHEIILDPYRLDHMWHFENGRWSTTTGPFSIYTSPGGLTVDHDCAPPTPQIPVAASSGNFYAGLTLEPCDVGLPGPPLCGGKVLTVAKEVAATHRMLPPQAASIMEGACCLPDDRCIRTTRDCCSQLLGDYEGDYTTCWPDPCGSCCDGDGIRGNADGVTGAGGEVDVADLTYLVGYLFLAGPPPPCLDEGNVDGITGAGGPVDVADLTYLVAYLFLGGPPPQPCP